ncbi:hypothetical protein SAMN05421644_10226 [Allochromatium warmingii]|uniref:Uncharacterized protein n=1 Tax=Allochromatium warmingii TaxID=61595 RepID=A0A1H3B568_ALLWA|nr:hypothetical protein [Allochromatium warmingii]SDX36544.1 hypothetical protein SAMN05421644_10226 [Allochromatium warmingii]
MPTLPAAPLPAALELVRCESAGLCCAFEAAKVSALHAVSLAPNAPHLTELLQQSALPEAAAQRLLELSLPHGQRRLVRVGEPVIHFSLPTHAIQPLPPLLAVRLRPNGVRALAWIENAGHEQLVIILDAGRLIAGS